MKAKFKAQVQYDMPRASEEKVEAFVFKKLWEEKNLKKEPEDPQLTLKPDLKKTNKFVETIGYMHPGQFRVRAMEQEQEEEEQEFPATKRAHELDEYWTCCQSTDPMAPGCTKAIFNHDVHREMKKIAKYVHTGKFERDKFDEKGRMVWSCCMSKGEDAEGCVPIVKDKERWILSSYT